MIFALQLNRLAENRRIAVEDAAPEGLAEHGQRRSAGNVFLASEFAADARGDAQYAEKSRGDAVLLDVLQPARRGEIGAADSSVRGGVQAGCTVANGLEQGTGLGRVDVLGASRTTSRHHQGKAGRFRVWNWA